MLSGFLHLAFQPFECAAVHGIGNRTVENRVTGFLEVLGKPRLEISKHGGVPRQGGEVAGLSRIVTQVVKLKRLVIGDRGIGRDHRI